MVFEILGETTDQRTGTRVIYAKSDVKTYIALVGLDFDTFVIQRRRVKHKAYDRMREDIIAGALLPTISLAVKSAYIQEVDGVKGDLLATAKLLSLPDRVNILDGLQRTHTLLDILNDGIDLKPDQTILLEFWLERDIRNLIYRIIILNAGQKPMSMRHQMELLFLSTKEVLENAIPGLEAFSERDESRRNRAKKYPLNRLSLAYYSYVTKSPEVDKDNIVAQQLQEEEILAQGEEKFGEKFDRFTSILNQFSRIDEQVTRIYPDEGLAWIGSENVLLSFFAATGAFDARTDGISRVNNAMTRLEAILASAATNSDPMALNAYRKVVEGFNVRKVNVGFATRKLLSNSFNEYFRAEGDIAFQDLWPREAD
jgi:hypothetical protein